MEHKRKKSNGIALLLPATALLLPTVTLSFAVRGRAELAELISLCIGRPTRRMLSIVGSALPFSVAELLLFSALPLTLLAVRGALGLDGRGRVRLVALLLTLLSSLYACFFFTLGVSYHGRGLGEKMGFEVPPSLTEDELITLCLELSREAQEHYPSAVPKPRELSHRLDMAYADFCDEYGFVDSLHGTPKELLASGMWTRLGVMGFYSYCFGQTVVNTAFPAFAVTYTCAHEMAHQRGVGREDEANFIAYLALVGSDDGYLRYCGYAGMLEYALCALADISPELFAKLTSELHAGVRADIEALWSLVRESGSGRADRLTDALNDAYLKGNGTEGRASYGYALRLLAGYEESRN